MFLTKSTEAFGGFGEHALHTFISGAGMPVTYETALQDPNVKACIRVIAQTISTLPLKLYKKQSGTTGKEWVIDDTSVMSHVLTVQPNIRQTTTEWVEQLVTQLMLFSDYYSLVKRSPSGKIIGLTPFNSPKQVSATEHGDRIRYDCMTNDGKSVTVYDKDILHIRDLSLKTYEAIDKIALAKSSIGLSLAATHNAEAYYKRGPRAGAFIQVDGKLTDESFARLSKQFNENYAGQESAHKIAILENGSKFIQNPYNLKDAQVLESRDSAIREIAAIFGVPIALLGISDPNMKDPESINKFFYQSCLQSIINKIESRFRLMLPREYSLRFDTSEYLKGDVKTNVEVAEKLFTRGAISRTEFRQRVGYQPDTKEEVYVVGSNNLVFGGRDDFTKNLQLQKQPTPNTEVENG